VELGFHPPRSEWGKGYATEAAGACLEAAFSALAMERVIAVVAPGNAASVRVLGEIGMRTCGRRRVLGGVFDLYDATRPAAGPDSIRFRAR
jgi:RimJ/RimL family protein N-acetyltransferase